MDSGNFAALKSCTGIVSSLFLNHFLPMVFFVVIYQHVQLSAGPCSPVFVAFAITVTPSLRIHDSIINYTTGTGSTSYFVGLTRVQRTLAGTVLF